MIYTLKGREVVEGPKGCLSGACIFCGELIHHFNCHGNGWCLGALVKGDKKYFLYHMRYDCTPGMSKDIWRCGCVNDYVENVGERCHNCGRPRAEAIPVAA